MQTSKRTAAALAVLAFACLAHGSALAAGGHHAVDDANILGRGECEAEGWWTHARDSSRLLHAGLNCGTGMVELGAAAEHERRDGSSATTWNVEAKWAREVADGFSVGLDLQPRWQAGQRPHYDATRVVALASWKVREDVAVHFNLGRDLVRGADDLARGGVALEWQAADRWSLLAEGFLEEHTHFLRAGARYGLGRGMTVDFSRAQRLSGPTPSNWTVGLTYAFGSR